MSPDTLQHELDRIISMTDDQLDRRYMKMTNNDKIEAFHRALVQENRNRSLQQLISRNHGLSNSSVTSWTLVQLQNPGRDTWKFCTHDEHNIQVFHNDDVWQDKYANGYYPTAEARTLWNKLADKGYEIQG